MLPIRLSVATRHMNLPLMSALQAAGKLGVQAVQLDVRNELRPSDLTETGRDHFQHQLGEQRLAISAFEFPTRRAFYDKDALDSRVTGIKAALDFAYLMKTTTVVARLGRIPDETDSASYELLIDVLNDIARHSNRAGTTLAITPTVDSPESVKRLIERVVEGPLGLNLDIGGIVMSGNDPLAMYRANYDRVLAVQVRDGLRDIDGQGQEVPVGRGETSWDELLATLHEGGYRGWMTITRSTGDDRIVDMAKAVKFVQTVGLGG